MNFYSTAVNVDNDNGAEWGRETHWMWSGSDWDDGITHCVFSSLCVCTQCERKPNKWKENGSHIFNKFRLNMCMWIGAAAATTSVACSNWMQAIRGKLLHILQYTKCTHSCHTAWLRTNIIWVSIRLLKLFINSMHIKIGEAGSLKIVREKSFPSLADHLTTAVAAWMNLVWSFAKYSAQTHTQSGSLDSHRYISCIKLLANSPQGWNDYENQWIFPHLTISAMPRISKQIIFLISCRENYALHWSVAAKKTRSGKGEHISE